MTTLIIRQPDGLWCTYSTVVDDFTSWDLTVEELWEDFKADAILAARRQFDAAVERAADGGTSSSAGMDAAGRDWQVLQQIRLRDVVHGGADEPGTTPADRRPAYMTWLAKWRTWAPGSPLPR